MKPKELLDICRSQHIELWCENDRLRYRASEGAMNDELAALLHANREMLIEYLNEDVTWRTDPKAAHERFPLTPVQTAYVLGRSEAFEYGGNACHLYVEYCLPANTNSQRLEVAWNAMVACHPMLRAVIEDNAWQRILPEVPWQPLLIHERGTLEVKAFEAHLLSVRTRLDHACVPLDEWPILCPELSIGPNQCVLHISVDFTIIDYTSLQILLSEWRRRYYEPQWQQETLEATFRDYVMAEQRHRRSLAWERDRDWWLARLDNLPGRPDLPLRPLPDAHSRSFKHYHTSFDDSSWDRFCREAVNHGLSPTTAVLAAFAEVVGRWSQTPTFCLNLTVLNRPSIHPQLSSVLGDFTTLTLLMIDNRVGRCFTERARTIGEQMFDDLDHKNFSGVDVLRELYRKRGSGADLMPVVFTSGIGSLKHVDPEFEKALPSPQYMISQTPQVWLDCQVTDQYGGLELGWDVREGLFPEGLIEAMFEDFSNLLLRLTETPATWTANANCLFREEREAPLEALPGSARSIAAGFFERALLTPDAPVVHDVAGTHTYREIAQYATAVRQALQEQGVGNGHRVAVMLPKSAWQLIAVLGILQAGAAYVPVDIRQPLLRRQTIISNAEVSTLICLEQDTAGTDSLTLVIDRISPDFRWPPPAAAVVAPDDLAYVIFTSGSTGTPKGVMLNHAAVNNTLQDINERYAVGAGDCLLGLAELSFDLSVYDMFGATAVGAQLVLPDPARSGDPSHWAELMRRYTVTLWNSVPAQGQMLIDFLESEKPFYLPGPRCVLWSGDWIPTSLPSRWWKQWPDSLLFSLGGATEAAIWSIEQPIHVEHTELPSIPYGRALRGQSVEVLDVCGRRCPPGVRGEIHIGGVGLAIGYLGDIERTAERFIEHADGRRLYRTGDLGRYLQEGSIEFLGREDDQVKIRGHRIELAELEAALCSHPFVKQAATVVRGEIHQRSLVSYVTLHSRNGGDETLRESFDHICDQAREALAYEWGDIDAIRAAVSLLDQACLASLAQWLASSGIFASDISLDFSTLCQRLGVPESYQQLMHHWLRLLEDGDYLEADKLGWKRRTDLLGRHPAIAWKKFADCAPVELWPPKLITYLKDSADSLAAQLAGEIIPTALMFPQGSTEIAEAMYSQGPHAKALHNAMAEAVAAIILRQPDRHWKLLELGAGTGAASRTIIARLAPLVENGVKIDYLFTDVSDYFIISARELFAKYPWVRFGHFDINDDLLTQGVAPQTMDIILSSGSLNNAQDTPALLAGLHQLIGADSWLVIHDLTREHNEISISQGLMMESARDSRRDDRRLFVQTQEWLSWMAIEPGDLAASIVPDGSILNLLGYDVLLSHHKTDRQQLEANELLAFAATLVPRYMLPTQLYVLDRLPITANGKVDRKALTLLMHESKPDRTGNRFTRQHAVDELESMLLTLWREVLENPELSAEEDFFSVGGDSLLLAQLIARVRVRVPQAQAYPFDKLLRWALSYPTVRGMADRLRETTTAHTVATTLTSRQSDVARNNVVRAPLNEDIALTNPIVRLVEGSGVPLVLIHEGLGILLPYRPLLDALGRKRPLLGMAVHDSHVYLSIPPEHLNAYLGRCYADALYKQGLKEVDLLGYCSGGLLAMELAKALVHRGVRVRELNAVSSYRIPYRVEDERLLLYSFAATLNLDTSALGFPDAAAFGGFISEALEQQQDCLSENALEHIPNIANVDALRQRVLLSTSDSNVGSDDIGRDTLYRLFSHSVQASQVAPTSQYIGSLRLFVPSAGNPLVPLYRDALEDYWRSAVIGELSVYEVPGGHFDCVGSALAQYLLNEEQI